MYNFTLLPHTADIKIRVQENCLERLFIATLYAMFCCMRPSHKACSDINYYKSSEGQFISRHIALEAGDLGVLLVDFLSIALSYADIYDEAYFDAQINSLTDRTVDATFKGVKVTGYDGVDIKAVTYHDLRIEKTEKGFVAEVVFDV